MNAFKKMTAMLAASAMLLSVPMFPVLNESVSGMLTASAEGEGTDGILTYVNHGNYIEITKCNEKAVTAEIPAEIDGVPVTMIGEGAFVRCADLTTVVMPDSIASIGYRAFTDCVSLMNVSMSAGLTRMEKDAFYRCTSLAAIDLPEGLKSIGHGAFYGCESLASVTIPGSVTEIDKFAFQDCDSLTAINVAEDNARYSSIDGVLLDGTKLIRYPMGKADTSYTVPEGVTGFEDHAFDDCQNLVSVTIPEGVTDLGWFAFSFCQNLTSVTFPGSLESISYLAFQECTGLTEITIPEGVTRIQQGAFYGCAAVTTLTIPESVTTIEDYAFFECTALTDVYYAGTEKQWSRVRIREENDALLNANIHCMGVDSGEPAYGDVDCNGKIDLLDAVLLNKHLMTGESLSEDGMRNADVDRNGTLDAVDSLNILKFCIDLIALPV